MSKRNSFIPERSAPVPAIKRRGPEFRIRSAAELIDDYPRMRLSVIEGLVRVGEIANVNAGAKQRKTFFVLNLALSVTAGIPWLGREVAKGSVLYIDNELHPETMASRIKAVASARAIGREDYANLHVVSLRGQMAPLSEMSESFGDIEPGRYTLIVLDALYRFMEDGADENSNGDTTRMYNLLDMHAHRLGCAFVIVHHASKGIQASKNVTDVGSGAGAQSRAADTHIAIRPHEEEGCAVMEAATRSWPRFDPVCLRWEYPVWTVDDDLDPTKLFNPTKAGSKPTADELPNIQDVVGLVRLHQPVKYSDLVDGIQSLKRCSERKAIGIVRRAAESDAIKNVESAKNKPAKYTLPEVAL